MFYTLFQLQNQKAMAAQQHQAKPQESVLQEIVTDKRVLTNTFFSFITLLQFNTSRWNETTPAQNQVSQQPELQLNMNSQGGFVPQFINNSPQARAESNPSPHSDSSFQVCFVLVIKCTYCRLL